MHAARPRLYLAVLLLAACALLAACGKGAEAGSVGPSGTLAPVTKQGAVSVSTRNTTRLGGADAESDAAGVARTVYPGLTTGTRPQSVLLIGKDDWPAALSASVLASAPMGWPLLFIDGSQLPEVTRETLEAMRPTGTSALGGAQVVRIATKAGAPDGLLTRTLPRAGPAATAAAVERLLLSVNGGIEPRQVIIVGVNTPHSLSMPAAGLAAESGAPILLVTRAGVPNATAAVLRSLHRPSIYVIAANAGVSQATLARLRNFGRVTLISKGNAPTEAAATNAIAVARFTDGIFGWGVKDPGHGLVFANALRPLDGPASALLSATAQYGPLLLLERATQIPTVLAGYLGNIQPAYAAAPEFRPVRGVYNHGWLIGDETASTGVTQSELDSLLEISPREASAEEASVKEAE
jgi:hypothetical protein